MPRLSTKGVAIETAPICGSAASGNPPRDQGFHQGNCPQIRIVLRKASNLSSTKSQSPNPNPSGFVMIGITSEATARRSAQGTQRAAAESSPGSATGPSIGHLSVSFTRQRRTSPAAIRVRMNAWPIDLRIQSGIPKKSA